MTIDLFFALVGYALVTSITPGPNNFMLLASGLNFGFMRSIPHAVGISVGFFTLLIGIGFGLGALLSTFPSLNLVLKVTGGSYLLYLAWRIATSGPIKEDRSSRSRPMTFVEAAAFQWINPKAWIMAITAMAIYTDAERLFLSVVLVAFVFALVNFPCVSVWASFGVALRQFLSDPTRQKWFNYLMGVLLALCLLPLLN